MVPGTHKLGLLSRRGHTLSDANIDKLCGTVVNLEAVAGESFLCHNFLVHRSGVNSTDKSRIGFSANYVDQRCVASVVLAPRQTYSCANT